MVDDGQRRGGFAGFAALVGGFVSFRVAVALATSVSVTAAVAGPLALQALRMRDEPTPESAAAPPTTQRRPAAAVPPPTGPEAKPPATPPEVEPVAVEGRVTAARPSTTTSTTRAKVPASPTTTTGSTSSAGLAAGVAADRSDAVDLDGARLAGLVYVFVTAEQVSTVRWWVDRPDRSVTPNRTASAPPFDLGAPLFDTASLSPGTHRVDVEFETPRGIERRAASFDVVR